MARLSQFHGKACPYCGRGMVLNHFRLCPTHDHIVPKIAGGRAKLVCCKFCNNLKGHMMPDEWDAFRAAFAGYWNFSPRDRRAALKKHKVQYVHGCGARPFRRVKQGSPPAQAVIVPPELVYPDVTVRACG